MQFWRSAKYTIMVYLHFSLVGCWHAKCTVPKTSTLRNKFFILFGKKSPSGSLTDCLINVWSKCVKFKLPCVLVMDLIFCEFSQFSSVLYIECEIAHPFTDLPIPSSLRRFKPNCVTEWAKIKFNAYCLRYIYFNSPATMLSIYQPCCAMIKIRYKILF